LGLERRCAELALDDLEPMCVFSCLVQQLAGRARVVLAIAHLIGHLALGDRWHVQHGPIVTLLQDMPDQVVDVQALHDQDDDVRIFVVQPRVQCPVVELIDPMALCIG
jgi:hypothetical protein